MKRREFVTLSVGGVLFYTLDRKARWLNAEAVQVHAPLRFFSAAEAGVVAAACERIFPSDENGPGAKEAAVVIYIDRQLAGPYGRDELRYVKEPFIETDGRWGGYQGRKGPQQIYRAGIKRLGDDFAGLAPAEQDDRLRQIETTMFFQMLRQHTVEGMFCDPLHGGNADMVGWQMIGYPGPLMSFRSAITVYDKGTAYRPKPEDLEEILGVKIKGLEDD
jgi:gluconate 2-dehydrogenase gamma chain